MAKTTTRKRAGLRTCPICGKPASERYQPFCSGRCLNIDLGRWLGGNYRVASDETPETEPESDGER